MPCVFFVLTLLPQRIWDCGGHVTRHGITLGAHLGTGHRTLRWPYQPVPFLRCFSFIVKMLFMSFVEGETNKSRVPAFRRFIPGEQYLAGLMGALELSGQNLFYAWVDCPSLWSMWEKGTRIEKKKLFNVFMKVYMYLLIHHEIAKGLSNVWVQILSCLQSN